jgi:hypothetical protein
VRAAASQPADEPKTNKADARSKQARVIANDRRHHESERVAVAFGARLSRRRGAQAPQADARLEEGERQLDLPDRERRQRAHPPDRLIAMPRVRIGPALPDREALDVEIARLRDLDIAALRRIFQLRTP